MSVIMASRIVRRTILQWRPFEEIITEDLIPLPRTYAPMRYLLAPTANATRVTQIFGKMRGPFRLMGDVMIRFSARQYQADIEKFRVTTQVIQPQYVVVRIL